VKYGVTTDYVLGLDVVLADGTLVQLGGKRIKDVAGLPLLKLFVGSEGTLGIVTRAILRLVPAQRAGATLVAAFPTMTAAAEAVVAIRSSLRPSMLELMDRPSIRAVESHRPMGLDTEAGALLVAQSDAPGTACAVEVESMRKACEAAGAADVFVTDDADEGEQFVQARRMVIPAVELLGELMLEDVGVPVPRLPELVDAVARIAQRHDLLIPVIAHAGDGNTHPLIVVPRGDDDAKARAVIAFGEIMTAAIALGGTITGEHGVGRPKKSALPAQLGDDVMALTRRVKDALDPDGILNPGAIL
jgi:glycolate oxidase